MAHEIDRTTGQAAVFVVGEPAWHKLGKVISSAVTSAEALKLAVLDWMVTQQPMYLANGKQVPGRVANVRTDTGAVLGVVGQGYQVFQNHQAFDFMDAIVADKLALYETAGSLDGGKHVWMLARIPKELRAAGDDVVKPYVLLSNGNDGTKALRMVATSVRVVCNNTLNVALGQGRKTGFTRYHSKSLDNRVEEARKNLGLIVARTVTFEQQIQALAKVSLSETQVQEYFQKLYPVKAPRKGRPTVAVDGGALLDSILDAQAQQRDVVGGPLAGHAAQVATERNRNAQVLEQIVANYHNATNARPGNAGTAWAAYNAVSEYIDHQSTVRGQGELAKANNRMKSICFGAGDQMKQKAFAAALKLTTMAV
jgi:phage/plasmid-like protein (TIGR03299 family)